MGLLDTYLPQPLIKCPFCGKEIIEWQSKDGPCGQFVWKQGERHPVDQRVDEEIKWNLEELAKFDLPQEFIIYASCCDQPFFLEAIGQKQEEVWSKTRLLGPEDVEKYHYEDPIERRKALRNWLKKFSNALLDPSL